MSAKKYTYDDWKEGKVVLDTTRMEYNKDELDAPSVVSLSQFDLQNRLLIKAEQEATFERLKNDAVEKFKIELDEKLSRSKDKSFLINKHINFYLELLNNEMDIFNSFTQSAFLNVSFEERYYFELQFHIEHYSLGGEIFDYSTVPSEKCKYHNNSQLLPEVYVEMIWAMLKYCQEEISLENTNEEKNDEKTESENRDKTTNIDLNVSSLRFFKSKDAYNFFLECKKDIPSRAKKNKKTNESEPYEVAKYSVIFNFMKEKSLIFKDVKHWSFIDYLKKEHKVNIPDGIKKFPYQPAESDLMFLKEKHKSWFTK
jgi:hypothetical protein